MLETQYKPILAAARKLTRQERQGTLTAAGISVAGGYQLRPAYTSFASPQWTLLSMAGVYRAPFHPSYLLAVSSACARNSTPSVMAHLVQSELSRPRGRYSNGSVRTCQNCARAKIRCNRHGATGSCERCERLGKECHFPETRSTNGGTKRESKDRRIDLLEAKVDQLLATSVSPSLRGNSTANGSPASTVSQSKDAIDKGLLTVEAANMLLNEFRTTLMPHCPFVVVPPQTSAESLRKDKPFLFLTILTATLYDNMPLQRMLEKEVKKKVSDCMIYDGPISFEVLQGLLVHIAWCQYHSRPRRFSQYLHLAISIITDLQLDRAHEYRLWRTRVNFNPEEHKESVSWGHDERRAVLGIFYFSSSVSQILHKQCTFPYMPYFDDCCKLLATDAEYASDQHLLHIVQLQRLSERITFISSQNILGTHGPGSSSERSFREMKLELEQYRASLPCPLNENNILYMQYYTAELYLCQISLFDHKPSTQSPRREVPFQIEALRMGLIAAKALLDHYVCLPLRSEMAFNNAIWIQIGFALTLACKLVVAASEPSIQPHTAELCRALDISSMLSRCILRIQALVTSSLDASGDRDVFYHYEQRLKRVQWWFENRMLSKNKNNSFQPAVQPTDDMSSSTAENSHVESSQLPLDGLNDYTMIPPEVYDMQWPGFFPDATIDEILVDWMEYTKASEQR
ncbi:transcriptional regulator WAR1 [Aspergillus awamori]|uniref:Transcriptional regulator WAR1 n=1 Tax=Aspergillus awamori TaxID=105351 RepID=A0A401KUU7_ASPAW|nr:transcriptional regulator WAR1 [Aspergillus awamori]